VVYKNTHYKNIIIRPSLGGCLKHCTSFVCQSVHLSSLYHLNGNWKAVEASHFVKSWPWTWVIGKANLRSKVKVTANNNINIIFLRTSSCKVDHFTSNQHQNHFWSIHHMLSNTFHQWKTKTKIFQQKC